MGLCLQDVKLVGCRVAGDPRVHGVGVYGVLCLPEYPQCAATMETKATPAA